MANFSPINLEEIRKKAFDLGWNDVGISAPEIPKEDLKAFHQWIAEGYHGDLAYMENTLRNDPHDLLPGAKAAVIFVTYYKQKPVQFRNDAGVIASYARGRDYHHVHRKRLRKFILWLEERSGLKNIAKGFSDSSPILEKPLAVQAGLGWMGKNTLLIHRRFGTFILLSGLLTTIELPLTTPSRDMRLPRCGLCQRCMDACPTHAIDSPYHLNATRCLSYHLIESKKAIPVEIQKRNPGYVFGCDICQDVCPHNLLKPLSHAPEFSSEQGIGPYLSIKALEEIEKKPEKLFGTPLQRRKNEGLRYTLETLSNSYGPSENKD